jgi:tRNA (guanine-N7-)-methyltransferase
MKIRLLQIVTIRHPYLLFIIASKYPISYDAKVEEQKVPLVPTIVDIGCGYGGLLFELSKEFP